MKRNFNYIVRAEFANFAEEQIVEAFTVYFSTKEAKKPAEQDWVYRL